MRISFSLTRLSGACQNLPALNYPLPTDARVAVLGTSLREDSGVVCLPKWDAARLERARPTALAGPWIDLQAVARLMRAGHVRLARLRDPLVVFSDPVDGPLSDSRRDYLWEWFGLPVYEQLRSRDGHMLAFECDAREGFHLAEGVHWADGGYSLNAASCPCGLPVPRVNFAGELAGLSVVASA